jgi:PTS system galactitol-specific IIC component
MTLGVSMGAVMLLMPRIIAIFMEGLVPVSEAARIFFQKRFSGREYYIGLDSAILIGHPITIAAAVLLIPTTLVLAAVLQPFGNTTIPFADLAATAFFVAMATPLTRGNLFRTYIIGTVTMAMVLLLASFFAPQLTTTAANIGYKLPAEAAGAAQISALSAGNLFAYVAYVFAQYGGIVGPIALLIGAVVGAWWIGDRQWHGPSTTARPSKPAQQGAQPAVFPRETTAPGATNA